MQKYQGMNKCKYRKKDRWRNTTNSFNHLMKTTEEEISTQDNTYNFIAFQ